MITSTPSPLLWVTPQGYTLIPRSERDRLTLAPSIGERCYHCKRRPCGNRFAGDWYWCWRFERGRR